MDPDDFRNPAWHQRSPRFWRRVARTVVCDAVALVALIFGLELGVRWLRPDTKALIFSETLTGGHPYALNSAGLRDREFRACEPRGRVEVLCIGNSATWGTGVAWDQTFPKHLERLLDPDCTASPPRVINAGGQGASVRALAQYMACEGLAFRPRFVVLGFSPAMVGKLVLENRERSEPVEMAGMAAARLGGGVPAPAMSTLDRAPMTGSWRDRVRDVRRALWIQARRVHYALYGSYAYAFWDANVRLRLYRWGVLCDSGAKPDKTILAYAFDVPGVNLAEIEVAYEELGRQVEELQRVLQSAGVRLIVVGIPCRFEVSERRADNERGFELEQVRIWPLERVGALCRALEVEYVDLRPLLRREREAMLAAGHRWDPLYIPFDYTHLNERGHALVAAELDRRFRLAQR